MTFLLIFVVVVLPHSRKIIKAVHSLHGQRCFSYTLKLCLSYIWLENTEKMNRFLIPSFSGLLKASDSTFLVFLNLGTVSFIFSWLKLIRFTWKLDKCPNKDFLKSTSGANTSSQILVLPFADVAKPNNA